MHRLTHREAQLALNVVRAEFPDYNGLGIRQISQRIRKSSGIRVTVSNTKKLMQKAGLKFNHRPKFYLARQSAPASQPLVPSLSFRRQLDAATQAIGRLYEAFGEPVPEALKEFFK